MEKKLKILCLQGIPASGKSKYAQEFIQGNEAEWVIVNKDSLREGTGKYWQVEHEKYIAKLEIHAVELALSYGLNVVIDGTNLNPNLIDTWKEIAEEYSAEIEFKLFKVSLEEAIERDKNRLRSVGEKVIKSFYYKYKDVIG